MSLEVGNNAPPFTLADQDGNAVATDDLKGEKALIVFIPFPFTRVCEGELCEIRDHRDRLGDLGAKVVVITCDTRFANKVWAEQHGFDFPILSDYWPHGEVSRAYGTFNEQLGMADRFTFVLDEDGIIRDIIASESLGTARPFESYTDSLEGM